ncbi:hypothetical protein ES703_24591 [subsurface metagenome]
MKFKNLLYLLLTFFIVSCINKEKTSLLPSSAGAPGDILLVMNLKVWEKEPGAVLKNLLNVPMDGLPQDEPIYDLMQINPEGFGKTYKSHRNIILTKIGSDQPEPKILVQKNVWANSQILLTILAPSDSAFIDLVHSNSDKIVSILSDTERKRLLRAYKSSGDERIVQKLADKYFLTLYTPKGYKIEVEKPEFVWISHEYRDIIQGILIYIYDYVDEETFTRDYLIEQRNKYLKKHVPGEIEGSYIITEPLFPPIFNEYELRDGKYTAEIRGLWRMQDGLAMGGPFVSISQLDETRNRVVTIEGFVFAPAHEKRDLLRQVEAIILSLEIHEANKTDK